MNKVILIASLILVGCGSSPGADDAGTYEPQCIAKVNPDGATNAWDCNAEVDWVWFEADASTPTSCHAKTCELGSTCIAHNEWTGTCQ